MIGWAIVHNHSFVAGGHLWNGNVFLFIQGFGGQFWYKWIIKIQRRLNKGHTQFHDLNKLKLLKKLHVMCKSSIISGNLLDMSRSCSTAAANKIHKSIFCKILTWQWLFSKGCFKLTCSSNYWHKIICYNKLFSSTGQLFKLTI